MIGRNLVVLAFTCSLLASARVEAQPDGRERAKQLFETGMRNYNVGEYSEALKSFKGGYLAHPDPVFLFNMGQCYRQLGDPAGAERQYRAYLREQPNAVNRPEVERFIAEAVQSIQRAPAAATPAAPAAHAEPPPATPAPAAPAGAPTGEAPGWARGSAYFGFVVSAVMAILGVVSYVTIPNGVVPSAASGGAGTVVFAVGVPIVAAGGVSARKPTGAPGVLGLRVASWVGYALTLIQVTAMLATIGPNGPNGALILGAAGTGLLSGCLMSIDNLVSHAQAGRATSRPAASRPSIAPQLALGRGPDNSFTGLFALAGTF